MNRQRRWFYQCGNGEQVPILSDELIHFKEWNPWNPLRGVNPLVSLALELEQDYYANKANSTLLKNNAIPQGLLKTDQTLRPEEADAIERRLYDRKRRTRLKGVGRASTDRLRRGARLPYSARVQVLKR